MIMFHWLTVTCLVGRHFLPTVFLLENYLDYTVCPAETALLLFIKRFAKNYTSERNFRRFTNRYLNLLRENRKGKMESFHNITGLWLISGIDGSATSLKMLSLNRFCQFRTTTKFSPDASSRPSPWDTL